MNKLIALAHELEEESRGGEYYDETKWNTLLAGLAQRFGADELRIERYRKQGFCRCGHPFSSHDPEDLSCDAPAAKGLGVCGCGR